MKNLFIIQERRRLRRSSSMYVRLHSIDYTGSLTNQISIVETLSLYIKYCKFFLLKFLHENNETVDKTS